MKALIPLLLTALTTLAAASERIQSSILDQPYQAARQEQKLVYVCFSASWCGPCRKLHRILENEPVKAIWDKYFVTVSVVVDERGDQAKLNTPHGNPLRTALQGDQAGIPFFAFLKADGTKLGDSFVAPGQNMGCPITPEEIAAFLKTLEQVAPTMTAAERQTIAQSFRAKT